MYFLVAVPSDIDQPQVTPSLNGITLQDEAFHALLPVHPPPHQSCPWVEGEVTALAALEVLLRPSLHTGQRQQRKEVGSAHLPILSLPDT